MVKRVQYESLMPIILAQVVVGEQSLENGQTSRPVAGPRFLTTQKVTQPEKPLSCNRGCGTVNRLLSTEGVCRPARGVVHPLQTWRSRVPVGDSIRGRILNVEVTGGPGGACAGPRQFL